MKRPTNLKLSPHARQRLEERKSNHIIYNTKNLMRSSCKWYIRDNLIEKSKLYQHSLYVCRKSPQLGYMTDGEIEVLFNAGTGVVITVMEVKDKFKPITQYIKPELLRQNETKKEKKKMKQKRREIGNCPDCGEENVPITSAGMCPRCYKRRDNALHNNKEYIPYIKLSEEERNKIDAMRASHAKKNNDEDLKEIPIPDLQVPENFYQVKAENNPAIAVINEDEPTNSVPMEIETGETNASSFIQTLRDCGCEIPENDLTEVMNVLLATDTMKNVIMTIVKDNNQQALLDLEQMLNVAERKLQHIWEYNGFQEEDDKKFKEFLNWRRTLKGAMFFWKKLYQSNALIELQKAWNSYTADPSEKITLASDKERTTSIMKRYQITTETISTIYNTRREFTRVFYATSEEQAHETFVKWLSERQLHENRVKTKIVELSNIGERASVVTTP